MPETHLFTVGHSNHTLARFFELLCGAGVNAIADVRSQPYSQWLPHFNRPDLVQELGQQEIAYTFLGEELGGRPADLRLYGQGGRVDYERVRLTPLFREGLDRLCDVLETSAVALLCAEEDPLDCHRGLMIAPALVERGIRPVHIRGDGSRESTEEMETRLLQETKVADGVLDGLFACTIDGEERAYLIAEAYRIQASRKAFRLR